MPYGLVLGPLPYLYSVSWRAPTNTYLSITYILLISKFISLIQTVLLNSRLDIPTHLELLTHYFLLDGKYSFGLNLSKAKPLIFPIPQIFYSQPSPTKLMATPSFIRPETLEFFLTPYFSPPLPTYQQILLAQVTTHISRIQTLLPTPITTTPVWITSLLLRVLVMAYLAFSPCFHFNAFSTQYHVKMSIRSCSLSAQDASGGFHLNCRKSPGLYSGPQAPYHLLCSQFSDLVSYYPSCCSQHSHHTGLFVVLWNRNHSPVVGLHALCLGHSFSRELHGNSHSCKSLFK